VECRVTSFASSAVAENLAGVRRRIVRAGADPEAILIVAVTKGQPRDAVQAALAAGLADVGENYPEELLSKAAGVGVDDAGPRWHFLGAVQRRQVRGLAAVVNTWQSVDRQEELRELAHRQPGARVFIQVLLHGGGARAGARWDEVGPLLSEAERLGIHVRGLMGVGPPGPADRARPLFARLATTARCHGLEEVSMGMSSDFETAVQEGATMLRLGTALFGPRPPLRSGSDGRSAPRGGGTGTIGSPRGGS
jgi:uncharacterized pyridoxal phosphate-containing UPF0001 family protein